MNSKLHMRGPQIVAVPRAGFTLIEMMAVVVILLLLVGVTMPTFIRTYRSELLRSEARVLMSTVQQARYQAVVRQHPMLLHMDFQEQAYWIEASTETVTNLTLQVFNMSTNSLAAATSPASETEDLSTNTAVAALSSWTRRDLTSGVRLEQLQKLDGLVEASGVATVACYPSGASQGGTIVFTGSDGDSLGVEIDPLTSLPRLVLDAQPK